MQSSRKKSLMSFGKQSNSYYRIHNQVQLKGEIVKKSSSSSVAIQTDDDSDDTFNLTTMPVDEIKARYRKTVDFINKCHEYMNAAAFGEVRDFKVPEIPNYFSVFELVLNKQSRLHLDEDDEQIVFDLKQFLPPSCATPPSKLESTNLKALSSTFEEILKTCNEFENKSLEYLLKNDVPLNEPVKSLWGVKDNYYEKKNLQEVDDESFRRQEFDSKTPTPPRSNDSRRSLASNSKKVNEMFQKIASEESHVGAAPQQNSSCESIILTDEEFHRKDSGKFTKKPTRSSSAAKVECNTKCNPLKLSDKDRQKMDEKVLRTIGLFTESGEILPGVIGLLEEKKRLSLNQNHPKNVRFRTQRKFDLEVRFNNRQLNNNNTSEEEEDSFIEGSQKSLIAQYQSATSSECRGVSSSSSINEPF